MSDEQTISIDVEGGGIKLHFTPGWNTGRSEDTNPGIGFEYTATIASFPKQDGTFVGGTGVFSRADATRLRDMINEFLAEHPTD